MKISIFNQPATQGISIANVADLEARLRAEAPAAEVVVFDVSNTSFRAQASAFASASLAIVPHGSTTSNAIWLPKVAPVFATATVGMLKCGAV